MVESPNINSDDYSFLRGGLIYDLLAKAGIAKPEFSSVQLRAALVAIVTYVPLVVLTALQGVAWGPAVTVPFLLDVAEACRFLLVGPLLILADALIDPWLIAVVRHVHDDVMPADTLPKYDKLVTAAARRRDSRTVEILLLGCIIGLQCLEVFVVPHAGVTTWRQLPASNTATYGYYFYFYFAKPLLRFLWLRWAWQYLSWSLFIARLPRLHPKIIPTFPDNNGGLRFIATGHQRFAMLALAFGLQAAGVLADQIFFEKQNLSSFKLDLVGIVVIILLIFLSPLLAYTSSLLEAKRLALRDYGHVALGHMMQFHRKWITPDPGETERVSSDIPSLQEMRNSYQMINKMSVCLINKTNIIVFAVATLLPFAPLLLTVYPVEKLVSDVLKKVM